MIEYSTFHLLMQYADCVVIDYALLFYLQQDEDVFKKADGR